MNEGRVLALGLALLVLLGLLAAGLRTLEFRAGRPIPEWKPSWGQRAVLPFPYTWAEWLLDLFPWLLLGIVILAVAIFRWKLLREFSLKVIAGLMLLALFGLLLWLSQLPVPLEEPMEAELPGRRQPGIGVPSPEPGAPASEGVIRELPVALPWGVTYLVAVALALLLMWWGWWWLARQKARQYPIRALEEGLQGAAAQAAAELRAGLPVEEVVIRCWARMAECLAGRIGGEGCTSVVTPRELARLLAERGVRHEAIAELTKLFEEVRYGGKADAPRRGRAIAALAAIEEAYGRA
ncbi:MAG: DUF4129 domain-containing protein [Candidatus Bipolaricaulia bacterium]